MDPIEMTTAGAKALNSLSKIARPIVELFPGIPEWSANKAREGIRRRAYKEVVKVLEEYSDKILSEEAINLLCANILRDATGDDNFLNVAIFASKHVDENADASKVDKNWAAEFRGHAEKAFDDEAVRTWGLLLAGELDSPGSFSKRTMSILADMSKSDAEAFTNLCGNCIATKMDSNGKTEPILTISGFNTLPLSDDEKLSLNALGITSFSLGVLSTSRASFDTEISIRIGKNEYMVRRTPDGPDSIEVVRNVFTKFGLELAGLCEIGSNTCFEDDETQTLAIEGFEVIRVDEWLPDNQQYRGTRIEPDAGRMKDYDATPAIRGTWKPLVPDIQTGGFRLTE